MSLVIAIALKSFFICAIGLIGFFFGPLIFEKKFRGWFSKRATLEFDNDKLSMDLNNRQTGKLIAHYDYEFDKIKFYKAADSAKDDSAFIKLIFNDNSSAYYTFLEQGERAGGKDVIGTFVEFVKAYNETKTEENKITPTPIFLASKNSKYYIIGLTILLIAAIIFEIAYQANGIPITVASAVPLYLLLLLQRKRDLDQFNRMK